MIEDIGLWYDKPRNPECKLFDWDWLFFYLAVTYDSNLLGCIRLINCKSSNRNLATMVIISSTWLSGPHPVRLFVTFLWLQAIIIK